MADATASFDKPSIDAAPCSFGFKLPNFSFGFSFPGLQFPPPLPVPRFRLALSCDLSKPLDVTAGVSFGGGRKPNGLPSPDDDDSF